MLLVVVFATVVLCTFQSSFCLHSVFGVGGMYLALHAINEEQCTLRVIMRGFSKKTATSSRAIYKSFYLYRMTQKCIRIAGRRLESLTADTSGRSTLKHLRCGPLHNSRSVVRSFREAGEATVGGPCRSPLGPPGQRRCWR